MRTNLLIYLMLVSIVVSISIVFSGCGFLAQPHKGEVELPIRILIYSDRSQIAQKVALYLEDEPGFQITPTADIRMLESLQGYDVVVLIPVVGPIFSSDILLSIRNFVHDGGGVVGMHDVLFNQSALSEIFGGAISGPPSDILTPKAYITVYDATHPIVQGIPKQFILLEGVHIAGHDPKAHRLLNMSYKKTDGEIQTYAAAWTYKFGKGKTFFFAPGDDEITRYNSYVIRMISNAARWMVQKEE